MSIGVHRAIDDRGWDGVGCPGCPYNVREVSDWMGCRVERQWRVFHDAVTLWRLFDVDESKAAEALISAVNRAPRDDDDLRVLTAAQRDALGSTLRALTARMEARWGQAFEVPADEVGPVTAVMGDRLDCWDLPDGRRCSLWNRAGEILNVVAVLEGAARLGRTIDID